MSKYTIIICVALLFQCISCRESTINYNSTSYKFTINVPEEFDYVDSCQLSKYKYPNPIKCLSNDSGNTMIRIYCFANELEEYDFLRLNYDVLAIQPMDKYEFYDYMLISKNIHLDTNYSVVEYYLKSYENNNFKKIIYGGFNGSSIIIVVEYNNSKNNATSIMEYLIDCKLISFQNENVYYNGKFSSG